jgi:acyl carrier protein
MSTPSTPSTPEIPPQLARFPQEVRDAFVRFRSTGDVAGVQIVVGAALVDFLPANNPHRAAGLPADDLRLIEDLGYDSLAIAELVFFLEDLFKVTISTEEIRNVSTVGDLHTFVIRKLAGDRPSA